MQANGSIGNAILTSLSAEDLALLRPHMRRVELAMGQVLYEPGDEVQRIYFPESGLISLLTTMNEGQHVETASRGRNGGIGYVESYGSEKMASCAVVHVPGEAWCLPSSAYREVYEQSRALRRQIHKRVEILLAEARQSVACLALHSAESRLARMLLETWQALGETRLPLTQEFMGQRIGVGRTTVNHAVGRLEELGFIRCTRGRVALVDVPGLKGAACECYDALQALRSQILQGEAASG